MSVVDVSRIPNNNKFDPVREAILQLEGIIESETAGVFSVNGEQGALTLQAGTNITITSPSEGVIEIASSAGAGGIEGALTLAAGDGIALSSPTVFDGTTDVTVTITNDDRPNAGILTIVAGSGLTTATAINWEDEPQTWSQQGRVWSVSEGNTFSANELNDKSVTLEHAASSSETSTTNADGVVIQNISIDNFGHVQSFGNVDLDDRYVELTDSRIAQWTAAYNDKINSATFNTSTGVVTLNQQDGGTVTVDIDGRFLLSTDSRIANWDEAYSWGDHALEGYLTSFTETDPTVPSHVKSITTTNISNWNDAYNDQITSASFNTGTGVITLSQQDGGSVTVDIDGRYVEAETDPTVPVHVKNITTTQIAQWTDAYNDQITGASFSTSTGIVTLSQQDGGTITVDLDGKYLNIGDKAADSNLLDGLDSSYFLNYNNLNNTPSIPTVYNNQITLSAGGGMTGGGSFTLNQSFNETITLSHADTSSQGSVNNSGRTYIQDITLDTYGHVIGLTSATDSDTTYTAGGGLTLSGTTFSHLDTSSQGSVNNSGFTFIQDVTLDTYGHVIGLGSGTVSVPTVNNNTITIVAGSSMSGGGSFTVNQSFNEAITINHGDTSSLSGTYGSTDDSVKIDTITVDSNGHITGITTGAVAGGGGTTPNNAIITIGVGNGLTGGGSFTTDQSFNETITVSHGNTSNLNGTYGSTNDSVKIDTITVDANGHITAITTGAVSGGGGGVGTLQQVTDLGNTTTQSVSIGKATAPAYTLDVDGIVRATNDVIAFSDRRVKENIETIPNALKKALLLRGVNFNKIGDDKKSVGVIAQEVEEILPEAVHTAEDGMKSVAYGNMVGLLIEAIKEQQQQINELKAIVNGGTK